MVAFDLNALLHTLALASPGSQNNGGSGNGGGSQSPDIAAIVVEASHGGAGRGLTNTTIYLPVDALPHANPALSEVSTLYLVGYTGTDDDIECVNCTPYKSADGTGPGGLPFNASSASYLSTNTVVVGSIVCRKS